MPLAPNLCPQEVEDGFFFRSQPNCSLTVRQRKKVFWGIAAMTLAIPSVFGWLGYWLALPFAGLEVGVLAWAFDTLDRQSGDYEAVRICGDEIVIERRQAGVVECRTFNCRWARMVLDNAGPGGKVKLALRSRGQETELGRYLTDEARLELAKALKTWVKTG